ncbi:MAG: hypothetical protein OXJ52_06195 [Oligoflexia bacterium]|nr:hypothetical protein [Oligoflexia bacterium]
MKPALTKLVWILLIINFVVAFSYTYPRFLVSQLGENSPWISYLYTYGMGFIVFSSSLIFIFTRQIDPQRRKQEFYWLIAIACGFLLMFFCQGLWIYSAIHFPVKS